MEAHQTYFLANNLKLFLISILDNDFLGVVTSTLPKAKNSVLNASNKKLNSPFGINETTNG